MAAACGARPPLGEPPATARLDVLLEDVPIRPVATGPRFEGDLETRLGGAAPDAFFRVLVDLTDQVDLFELGRRLRAADANKLERRRVVIEALERVAARQQDRLWPSVEDAMISGDLHYVRRVAIVNRLIVEGSARGILALADHPDVHRVRPEWSSDRKRGSRASPRGRSSDAPAPVREASFTSWAIERTGIPELWERGIDGRGVVVAAIDTGVYAEHEQFGGDRAAPGPRGWYDPVESRDVPYDNHGHGTSVLSIAVGGGVDARRVGVAPRATWSMVLGNWRNHYSRVRMTLAADHVLRVVRPDVLINAWSHDEGECTSFDLPFIDAWRAAEIFVVFPAGNAGPGAATGESPAQLTGAYPDDAPVLAVASTGETEAVHDESSRGPSRCRDEPFPTLAAPGAAVPFAFPPAVDGYGRGNGTSLAAGWLGGAAALVLQVAPDLSPVELERLFIRTARDIEAPGPDVAAGYGVVDVVRAVEAARSR